MAQTNQTRLSNTLTHCLTARLLQILDSGAAAAQKTKEFMPLRRGMKISSEGGMCYAYDSNQLKV